jgi:hypothetical protein
MSPLLWQSHGEYHCIKLAAQLPAFVLRLELPKSVQTEPLFFQLVTELRLKSQWWDPTSTGSDGLRRDSPVPAAAGN